MHLYDADATMEDTELLGMAFHGQQFTLPVYGYHAWWRDADAGPAYAYHRRVVKLLESRRPPRPLVVQGAAPQLPPRCDRGRLSRRALRRDAPRPDEGGAVVDEPGVGHLPRTGRRARPAPARAARSRRTCASASSAASRRGRASARTGSSTSTTPSSSPIRWAPYAASTPPSTSSSRRRSRRRSSTGTRPTAPAPTARTATRPSSSA